LQIQAKIELHANNDLKIFKKRETGEIDCDACDLLLIERRALRGGGGTAALVAASTRPPGHFLVSMQRAFAFRSDP